MTPQQKRLLWIGGIAFVAFYYVVPTMINVSRQAEYRRRLAAQAAAAKAAQPLPASAANPGPAVSTTLDNLLGTWQGGAPLPVGMCNLKFELRRKPDDSSHFAGYPVLGCIPILNPLPGQAGQAAAQQAFLSSLSPVSAVLTGTAAGGGIQFTVDKVIGKTIAGCALTTFSITPFGNDQLAAEWQEGACQGGQILLKKIGK